jgi:hypothetical protein
MTRKLTPEQETVVAKVRENVSVALANYLKTAFQTQDFWNNDDKEQTRKAILDQLDAASKLVKGW